MSALPWYGTHHYCIIYAVVNSAASLGSDAWFKHRSTTAGEVTTSELIKENSALRGRVALLTTQTAPTVFRNVCTQQRFQCSTHMTADSEAANWRAMTPTEVQLCNLACR